MSHNKIHRTLEELQSMKIVGDIFRFPGESERAETNTHPSQYTHVTIEQMLHEMLYAIANGPVSYGEETPNPVTVSFGGGESQEEYNHRVEYFKKRGLPVHFPRQPGHHTISLWKSTWEETDDHEGWNNEITATFMFTTEPEEMYWNGD